MYKEDILLSIIIPVYNCADFIQSNIESLVEELHDNYEVLIVNDGSTDNTQALCEPFLRDNIQLYNKKNGGVSSSRNYAIELARGKYLMFLDADDRLINGWSSIVDPWLKGDEDVVYFGNDYPKISVSKQDLIYNIFGIKNNINLPYIAPVWSKLFRRSFVNQNKIRFVSGIINGEDVLFGLQLILLCTKFRFEDKSIYEYMINEFSSTHKYDSRFIESNNSFLREAHRIMQQERVNNDVINSCINFSEVNSTVSVVQRISYIQNFSVARRELKVVDKHYLNRIRAKKHVFSKFSTTVAISFFLIQNHMQLLLLILFRVHNKIMKSDINNKYIKI